MAITQVQKVGQASTASGTSLTATLGGAPTAGNLLICCANGDDARSGVPNVGSGRDYTLADGGVGFCGTYIFYRVAQAGDSATTTYTIASSTSIEVAVYEYSGLLTSGVLDKTANSIPGASVGTLSTGTTATTTQADELAVGLWGTFNNTSDVTAYTNSFTEQFDLSSSGSGTNDRLFTGVKILSATGAVESTATFSTNANNPVGVVATFKAATDAGSVSGPYVFPAPGRIGPSGQAIAWAGTGSDFPVSADVDVPYVISQYGGYF